MKPGFARDQSGEPWLIVERAGALWALGFNPESTACLVRPIGDDNSVYWDLSKGDGIRWLTPIKEQG